MFEYRYMNKLIFDNLFYDFEDQNIYRHVEKDSIEHIPDTDYDYGNNLEQSKRGNQCQKFLFGRKIC